MTINLSVYIIVYTNKTDNIDHPLIYISKTIEYTLCYLVHHCDEQICLDTGKYMPLKNTKSIKKAYCNNLQLKNSLYTFFVEKLCDYIE